MDNDTLDLRSLAPRLELGRRSFARGFAMTGLTAGFALAVQPIAAQTTITTDIATLIREVVSKAPDAQVMADLDATAAWAAASSKGDPARLGVTGFCWGGRITWLYAAHQPRLKAGVAWYGRLVGDPTPNQPKHPIDLVEELKAPVLGLYGGKDQGIPLDTVEMMQEAAKKAGKTVEFVVYPDAPHAFHADYRPSYREGPAKDGWQRCLAWFARYLVA